MFIVLKPFMFSVNCRLNLFKNNIIQSILILSSIKKKKNQYYLLFFK
jgi:hypothetical protein